MIRAKLDVSGVSTKRTKAGYNTHYMHLSISDPVWGLTPVRIPRKLYDQLLARKARENTMEPATVANVPRARKGLLKLGRFMMRKLAEELGILSSHEGRIAFCAMDDVHQVGVVLKALRNHDRGLKNTRVLQ